MQLGEGLYVMLFGMGIVFLSLTLIMLAMIVLDRVFSKEPEVVTITACAPEDLASAPDNRAAEVALAITLAVARARGERRALPSGEEAARRWNWVWDEGLDDYGVTKGSAYGSISSNG
ncbi:MAG: OadG family protein [Chloroflexota bacterium]